MPSLSCEGDPGPALPGVAQLTLPIHCHRAQPALFSAGGCYSSHSRRPCHASSHQAGAALRSSAPLLGGLRQRVLRACGAVCARAPSCPRILLLAGDLRGGPRTSEWQKERWPRHLIWVFTLVLLWGLGFLVCPVRRVAPHLHTNRTLGTQRTKRTQECTSSPLGTGTTEGGAGLWEESRAFRLSPASAPLG